MAQVIWNSDIDVYNQSVIPLSIARGIAKYLSVQDLWAFRQVSRNAFAACNDYSLWCAKLKTMEVTIEPGKVQREDFLGSLGRISALTCMDMVSRDDTLAKYYVMKIHKCLYPYYLDLQSNKAFDRLRMFLDFKKPEEHAKILNNIRRYNRIDFNSETRDHIEEKINSLYEIFENAILRELEIHFDLGDYDKAKQFINILIYLKNQQTLIDFFLQKSIFDGLGDNDLNPDSYDINKFFKSGNGVSVQIYHPNFVSYIAKLATQFNQQAALVDALFPDDIPIMFKVCEELIMNNVGSLVASLVEVAKSKGLHLTIVPFLYTLLTTDFVQELTPSRNMGESYTTIIKDLIDMFFENIVNEYVKDEVSEIRMATRASIEEWNVQISEREQENTQSILKHVKVEAKNDLLQSFKKVFSINSPSASGEQNDEGYYSEMEAKIKILSANIKSLNQIFSMELAVGIINEAKQTLHRLTRFKEFPITSARNDVISAMQEVFAIVVGGIANDHLKPGFMKAIEYLKSYKPTEQQRVNDKTLEPLVFFCELINMADIIIQMIDIFYKEEIVHSGLFKNENSIANVSLQWKKNFESQIDAFVAEGLNVGVDILIGEIEKSFEMEISKSEYNSTNSKSSEGPSEGALRAISILNDNFDLLVGCTDKSVVDVFQQEIAERFFHVIVKSIKASTVSVPGAVRLITDINFYNEFIVERLKSNKRMIIPLFQALKKVGNIYLVSGDDSKAIGKLVSDLSKFNGIFSQEEIFEFVQRRTDWNLIKKDVEKVVYGLNLADCRII